MIDWDKPIETVDGRGAKIIARLPNAADAPTMVWIESDRNGFGDVFLVNNEGYRCDDRALFSARQEPFIRNAPVKREGWVLMRPPSASMQGRHERFLWPGRYLADDHVYDTEAEAQSAKAGWYGADPGVKAVHLTWEE